METRKLSLQEMEAIEGGTMSCAAAIAALAGAVAAMLAGAASGVGILAGFALLSTVTALSIEVELACGD
ncbi:MAG TPA: hypothetical protein PKH45_03235 [Tenuifilaceae bacterium]|mgnify:CR=1 FL=1|nr:hypothetical protein [Tenuifilaceae bacterium]